MAILPQNWYTTGTIEALQKAYDTGAFDQDDLLHEAQDLKDEFFWQSHTFSHLARDNLAEYDCSMEDGGTLGLFTAAICLECGACMQTPVFTY